MKEQVKEEAIRLTKDILDLPSDEYKPSQRAIMIVERLFALLSPKGESILGLTNEQLAYIAGLVDGEAYIGIQKTLFKDRRTLDYAVRFELAMTDRDPIDYINNLLPKPKAITCQIRDRQLPYYRLKLSHGSAVRFLQAIAPFLHSRRAKVDLCVQLEELRKRYSPNKNHNGLRCFPQEYLVQAESIYQQLSALQKKNRPKMEVNNE